jgi:ribosomal protein S18 acetylase RimI-like enzyme
VIVQNLQADQRSSCLRWLSGADHVYQHVGWHPLSYWLGRPVSVGLQKPDGTLAALLLVSPDHLGVAWIHLFAANTFPGARRAWEKLWPYALDGLRAQSLERIWVMTTQPWFAAILRESGFSLAGHVVALMQTPASPPAAEISLDHIAPIREADLAELEAVDHAAFDIPWRLDADALRETRTRAILAMLYRREGKILGYQMAVPTAQGVHLARLAVEPAAQRQGIGRALTTHLLGYFAQRGVPRITVNTQSDNLASLRLYRRMGFQPTGDDYPVFRYSLPPDPAARE